MPTLTPELRDWLEQERTWGAHARHAISQLSRSAPPHPHGLERFRVRMALVDLTGSVAAWAKGLLDGLTRWGFDEAAAAFQTGPPFPATDLSAADYDRLAGYVEKRMGVLRELTDADEPKPQKDGSG